MMEDPEMKTTGYGMIMQLRKNDPTEAGASSSGFEGVERLDLLKNVDVMIRDVGNSGSLPGPCPVPEDRTEEEISRRSRSRTDPSDKPAQPTTPVKPTPLHLTCDSRMQCSSPSRSYRFWSVHRNCRRRRLQV